MDQHHHELTVSLSSQPIWVYADPARIEQVVVNLLTNAAKYTADGGTIAIAVQREGDQAVLRVRDSGVGIAPELLPQVFELFTQADRSMNRSQGGLGIDTQCAFKTVLQPPAKVIATCARYSAYSKSTVAAYPVRESSGID